MIAYGSRAEFAAVLDSADLDLLHPSVVEITFVSPSSIEILATVLLVLAVLHSFSVGRFVRWAHHFPNGSLAENTLHFLSETEVVFGLWGAVLFAGIACVHRSIEEAVHYIETLNFNEPKFVLAIMVVAATRPIVAFAEAIITRLANVLPFAPATSFYVTALGIGPLIGSLITEPAAMTLLAIMLKGRYFDQQISRRFAYASLGLLFVNVSIGGTLTHFAAPPVLMVAEKWGWDTPFMLTHFGWRAAIGSVTAAALTAFIFRRELSRVQPVAHRIQSPPLWLTLLHLLFLAAVVYFAHHPDVFFGVFMLFLGIVTATREYQDRLKLREGLLVGFFLAGLVTLGSLQGYWLRPLVSGLSGSMLYFGATLLTAITDNAALTYLGSLVKDIKPDLQYALVAGAVTGGGLTVIANAPNPAGVGILQKAKVFEKDGISPISLLLGALLPTAIAIVSFWII